MLITYIYVLNTKNCFNIDTLDEGEEITISAVTRRGFGKKDNYILYTEEQPGIANI